MKNLFFFIVAMIISVNLQGQRIDLTEEHVVAEGVGLAEYPLDKTKLSAIIADFGNNYEIDDRVAREQEAMERAAREDPRHLLDPGRMPIFIEVKYKDLGLAFYYLSTDSTKIIRAVRFFGPIKVRTDKGIVLNESTMGDVIELYDSVKQMIRGNPPTFVHVNRYLDRGTAYSSKLSGYGKDEFPKEEVLKEQVVDEIYIYNYQDEVVVGQGT